MKPATATRSGLFALHDGWSLAPEGAAVHRDEAVAVIADVHLGYEWARGQGGDCIPAHSLAETLRRLERLLGRVEITRLVVAGDLVESPKPCLRTEADVRGLTDWLAARGVALVALPGNHDPVEPGIAHSGPLPPSGGGLGRGVARAADVAPPPPPQPSPTRGEGGREARAPSQQPATQREETCTRSNSKSSSLQIESPPRPEAIEIRGWTIAHGHRPLKARRTITGHHHPALRASGVSTPCFLVGPTTIVLPAFSTNAAGWNVATGRSPGGLSPATLRCVACAGEEWLDFGPIDVLARRMRAD